ncbi:murein transglycosylase A [Hyphomicrobium sp. 99]|uniref:murein transglycosylase A n=1 Tax=Hyphomicrobium sp. 99 TaxID=1163419 RepID=UPI0005F7AF4E|nr:MltA domain-containing protein [Hyphomicrobium sp. 99]
MTPSSISFEPISFDDLPGWRDDDHLAAWKAFLASCGPTLRSGPKDAKPGSAGSPKELLHICARAVELSKSNAPQTSEGARSFFEAHFQPNRVVGSDHPGLLTGYYEPVIKGSRTPDETFKVPIYRRPRDLVNMVPESERGAKSAHLTHKRKTDRGLEPHLTRAEIEEGGLFGLGLELFYLKDPVDAFFMQVQGSGRIELPNGDKVRITYDGKNGYPYTSIGRVLIDDGHLTADEMSLKTLKKWLKTDKDRAKPVMRKNQSYVFFKELSGQEAKAPVGVNSIPLQPLRSLAVDTTYYAIGTPIYVDAPQIKHATASGEFRRLMIAHDVGSAIKGSERGDIFFGSGDKAGRLAGVTKQPGHLYALLPLDRSHAHKTASDGP